MLHTRSTYLGDQEHELIVGLGLCDIYSPVLSMYCAW